ncbi:TATA box-binding protein-associated factor RNA polymerase I subunit A-like [Argonauta hians]
MDDLTEGNLSGESFNSLYTNLDVPLSVDLKRMKKILTIILQDTNCYRDFISTVDETSTDEGIHWLEDIWRDLAKSNNLSYEKNTRGVPQKLEYVLRECLLMHRWHELARILSISHRENSCNLKRSTWKIGLELIYSNPFKDKSNLVERMSQLFSLFSETHVSHIDIQLQQLWYQLLNNNIDEAIQELQSTRASSKLKTSASNYTTFNKALYTAYQGLVWFVKWIDTRNSKLMSDSAEIEYDTLNFTLETQMKKMQACFTSEEVKKHVDVRDIFVNAEREALELNGNFEDVEKLLKDYCISSPENPNSHRYYYDYLCRMNACEEYKIEKLRNFVSYIPSDPLVLTLCDMISDNYSEVLKYLFQLLDYSCWQMETNPWSRLANVLDTLIQISNTEDFRSLINSVWLDRCSWWPSYHFTLTSVEKEKKLILYKALVAIYLQDKQLFKYIDKVKHCVNHRKLQLITGAEDIVFNKQNH